MGFVSDWTSDSHLTHYLPSKMKVFLCGPKLQSGGIHDIYLPMLLQSIHRHLIMILHNYLEISRIFGHMMQVFPPVWKWSHYAIIEAVEPFKLHPIPMPYIYKVYEQIKQLWRAYDTTLIPLPPQTYPQIWESSLKSFMMVMWKWSHYAIIEAVEPFKLHTISIRYIYEVFEKLKQSWRAYGSKLIPLPPQTYPQIWESSMKSFML